MANLTGYLPASHNDQERTKAIEGVLYDLAISGNLKACQYWLEKRDPDRWWSGDMPPGGQGTPLDQRALADMLIEAWGEGDR